MSILRRFYAGKWPFFLKKSSVQSPRPCLTSAQASAACARIDEFAVGRLGRASRSQRDFNVFARTCTGIDAAALNKLIERRLIPAASIGLVGRRFIRKQATAGELTKDLLGSARDASRGIDIFHTNQPFAAVCACI